MQSPPTMTEKADFDKFLSSKKGGKKISVAFRNLSTSGVMSTNSNFQKNVLNVFHYSFKREHVRILDNFNGVLNSGEICVVLGRPGR